MASATKDNARIRKNAFGGGSTLLFKDCVMMENYPYFLKDAMGCLSLSKTVQEEGMDGLTVLAIGGRCILPVSGRGRTHPAAMVTGWSTDAAIEHLQGHHLSYTLYAERSATTFLRLG